MIIIQSFVKQILKGAAVQLGVQAVVETAWPKVKKGVNTILNKLAEKKNKEELQVLVTESEKKNAKNSKNSKTQSETKDSTEDTE